MRPIDAFDQSNDQWALPSAGSGTDDPLLSCLVDMTRLIDKPMSAETLTAG